MPLTDIAARNAKPADKPFKLTDSHGLCLLVNSAGKYWRWSYRYARKRKTISFGVYPAVTLAEARERRDEARKLLAAGTDPSQHRQSARLDLFRRAAASFEAVAREWFAKYSPGWAESHSGRLLARLERDVFPWLGARPIADITPPELLQVARRIEARGTLDTAHRAIQNCGQVFRYAVATGRAERDITADLRGALPPAKGGHFAAVTDPTRIGALLRAIDGYDGTAVVRAALRLAPLVIVRPGELRKAEWAQFDLEAAEWRFTTSKTDTPHIVPLSSQAVAILRELHDITGHGQYVFPSARSPKRPMSDNAILAALRRMGIGKDEMSGHGFRAMARTVLDEVLGVRSDFIEHQLAHAVRDPNGRAYNRTAHLAERRKMMQQWSGYLDELKAGAEIVQLACVA